MSTIGALSLVPENASRSFRLQVLAGATLARTAEPPSSGPALSPQYLRKLVNGGPLARQRVVQREDPFESPFTDEITFHGGSFVVFPGPVEEATFILRCLVTALFLIEEPFPHETFVETARALILAVLALSDAIARRAGLPRGIDPGPPERRQVVVPNDNRLSQLRNAVYFSAAEYATVLEKYRLSADVLNALTIVAGTTAVAETETERLHATPIIAVGDARIVALPGLLVVAVRHAVTQLAAACGVIDALAERVHAAVLSTVCHSLDQLGLGPLQAFAGSPTSSTVTEAVCDLDADKLLYLTIATDPIEAYDPDTPYSPWSIEATVRRLNARVSAKQEQLLRDTPGVQAVLALVLLQGIGRPAQFQLDDLPLGGALPALVMSVADLNTIALLERGKPLVLWYYVLASEQARQHVDILTVAALDEFHCYRSHNYSYPPVRDGAPAAVYIPPGGAGDLRRELRRSCDWHGAPFYGGIIEVVSAYGHAQQPIYTPVSTGGKQVMFLVEGLPLPLWVASPILDDSAMRPLVPRYIELTSTIACWVWQCTPALIQMLDPLAPTHLCAHIRLHLPADDGWMLVPGSDEATATSHAIEWVANRDEALLVVTIHSAFRKRLEGPDNAGERLLVWEVLAGLRDLLPVDSRHAWPDEALQAILERYVPLGLKKRISAFHNLTAPELDPRGLPPALTVEPAVTNMLRHDLRVKEHSWSMAGTEAVAVPKRRVLALLNSAVSFYYQELEHFVASLDPTGLLEELVALHEALIFERATLRLAIPTLSIGLAQVPEAIAEQWARMSALNQAAIAARFVIEYVAARPPRGTIPMSREAYDRLLALSSLIIEMGVESDLVNYDLLNIGSTPITPFGLMEKREAHRRAVQAYSDVFTFGETARMLQGFGEHWREPEGIVEPTTFIAQVDAATSAEWGISLTELLTLMGALAQIGDEIDHTVIVLPLGELRTRLAAKLSWPPTKVDSGLDASLLKPRIDFLKPPPPYQTRDTYPWVFNRALSMARRPVLLRTTDGVEEVLWGQRHLYSASRYLVDLVASGRIEATSAEMRRLKGTIHQRQGRSFNDAVMDLLIQANRDLVVWSRVAIIDQGRDLGDVDVLVANPRQRLLHALECKCLVAGRMPHEWRSELTKLLAGEDDGASAVEKHQRRIAWLRAHAEDLLHRLGLGVQGVWEVEPLIVIDQEMFTPYLRDVPIPILSFEQFRARIPFL